MKTFLLPLLLTALLCPLVFADTIESNSATDTSLSEDKMLEILGYMTVYRSGLKELGFDGSDADAIARGIKKALSEDTMDPAIQNDMPAFQAYIEERLEQAEARLADEQASAAEKNSQEGAAFIAKIKSEDDVESTESGLHYRIHNAGSEERPSLDDTVTVHYKGTRIDGTQFDSSYDRGAPADFPLRGVVSGFAEGLTKIGEGGRITLYIPSDLAYGNNPRPGVIQPGDTLIFECELIKINP